MFLKPKGGGFNLLLLEFKYLYAGNLETGKVTVTEYREKSLRSIANVDHWY